MDGLEMRGRERERVRECVRGLVWECEVEMGGGCLCFRESEREREGGRERDGFGVLLCWFLTLISLSRKQESSFVVEDIFLGGTDMVMYSLHARLWKVPLLI